MPSWCFRGVPLENQMGLSRSTPRKVPSGAVEGYTSKMSLVRSRGTPRAPNVDGGWGMYVRCEARILCHRKIMISSRGVVKNHISMFEVNPSKASPGESEVHQSKIHPASFEVSTSKLSSGVSRCAPRDTRAVFRGTPLDSQLVPFDAKRNLALLAWTIERIPDSCELHCEGVATQEHTK